MPKTVASPASDGVAQIRVSAAMTAARALEPRPTHTRHWPIPNDCDAGSIDPNIGRPSGDQALVVFKQSECHQCENKACGRCGIPRELVRRGSEQHRRRNETIRKLETYQV
jgi:hypothetical protein